MCGVYPERAGTDAKSFRVGNFTNEHTTWNKNSTSFTQYVDHNIKWQVFENLEHCD